MRGKGRKMSTMAVLLNHRAEATESLAAQKAAPLTSSTSGSSASGADSSSSDSATISANDFLTLLVTEMQNQDPTSTTDPNEYINQLVEVNSLEQLISINQTLTTDLGSSSSSSTNSASTQAASAAAPVAGAGLHTAATLSSGSAAVSSPSSSAGAGSPAALPARSLLRNAGNLSVPEASPAAEQVAHALAGRSRAVSAQESSLPNP